MILADVVLANREKHVNVHSFSLTRTVGCTQARSAVFWREMMEVRINSFGNLFHTY